VTEVESNEQQAAKIEQRLIDSDLPAVVEVARRLQATIRVTDVAARQGGDEFTILLDRVRSVDEATESARRIAAALDTPIELDGRAIVVGVSIGIAMAGGPEIAVDDLLAHADAAMYEAKGKGRGRHAVFDPSMRILARSRLEMEAELRTAIDEEQFELHYQPIIDLRSNRIAGFEALVRWRHPTRGLIQPMEFIPLAEASGLIVPLGQLITAAACRQLRALRDAGICGESLTMSVNVSPRQAVEPGFAAEVTELNGKLARPFEDPQRLRNGGPMVQPDHIIGAPEPQQRFHLLGRRALFCRLAHRKLQVDRRLAAPE